MVHSYGTRLACVAALGLALTTTGTSFAQRLIVETTTLSAMHEAARVYLQAVDMDTGTVLPGSTTLPGIAPFSPLLLSPDDQQVVLATGPVDREDHSDMRNTWAYWSSFQTTPFQPSGQIAFEQDWRPSAGCVLDGQPLNALIPAAPLVASEIVTLGTYTNEAGVTQGRLDIWTCPLQKPQPNLATVALPGSPIAVLQLPQTSRIAVLCGVSSGANAVLAVVDVSAIEFDVEFHDIENAPNEFRSEPTGLARSGNGRYVFVLTSGYSLDGSSGETSSWLHAFNSEDFQEIGPPVQLSGEAHAEDHALLPSGDVSCWVATRSPGTDFAYAARLRVNESGFVKEALIPLTGVLNALRIAPSPDNARAAIAFDNHLEIWQEGQRDRASQSYAGAISAARWTREGLLIGESGRIHLVDPGTLVTRRKVQLQNGRVTDFVLIPTERLPVPGIVPKQSSHSPRLELPAAVTFHGGAVGEELKALAVDLPGTNDFSWRAIYNREQMPWLFIHPVTGLGSEIIYMGVSPEDYTPGKLMRGTLTINVSPATTDATLNQPMATTVASNVEIRVLPEERSAIRRILWIRNPASPTKPLRSPADPCGFRALEEWLAAPPYLFAHREVTGPFQEALDPYAIVVLDAVAALKGVVARQVILDYVMRGGALLLLGKHIPNQGDRELTQWLGPIGIQIDTNRPVNGFFPASNRKELYRHWDNFEFRNGCSIYAKNPSAGRVPNPSNPQEYVFLAHSYAHGRMAVLAAATPLQTPAMQTQANRLFAGDLFLWLARAGTDIQDMDGDALTDDVEDRNQNGKLDPGETDYLNADTDNDGLPDGVEDANLNGWLDEGETSALNPDSDEDGVWDGADETPLPPLAAPVISSVYSPRRGGAEGPAEGSFSVRISGRNFAQDAKVWFGSRPAPEVSFIAQSQLMAEVPPCQSPKGGLVAIRVLNESDALNGVLPNGFRYTPRSRVRLVLDASPMTKEEPSTVCGTVSIRLEAPSDVAPDKLLMVLETDPLDGFQWNDPPPSKPSDNAPWSLVTKKLTQGGLLVGILKGKGGRPIVGKITSAGYKLDHSRKSNATSPAASLPAKLRIFINKPRVFVQNGQYLDVITEHAELDLRPFFHSDGPTAP